MKKKILVAVDDSINSRQALGYSIKLSEIIGDLSYTILNVQKSISQFIIDEAEKRPKAMEELAEIMKENEIFSNKILKRHREIMIQCGISPDRIETVSRQKTESVAKEIMAYGQKYLFDAVFVGRRGASRIQKTFMGSVTANILEHCTAIPVWLIDGTVMNSKIMVAVDGSDSSRRAIDHLSFMIEGDSQAEIMLFHVASSVQKMFAGRSDRKKSDLEEVISESLKDNIDQFVSSAIDKFEKAGLKKDNVRVKISKRFLNPGRAIIEESQKGDYGTVVLGRSGISRSVFTGSVSRYVINNISNRVLCIVS